MEKHCRRIDLFGRFSIGFRNRNALEVQDLLESKWNRN
uniref:Uncharacterized protein n=1 Tax=Arundo donax TaxID=35708 RepID=A0A0A8Y2Q7_ARUDO